VFYLAASRAAHEVVIELIAHASGGTTTALAATTANRQASREPRTRRRKKTSCNSPALQKTGNRRALFRGRGARTESAIPS
jgi:hypothetical protein